jgi:hypothetical protein
MRFTEMERFISSLKTLTQVCLPQLALALAVKP